MKKLIQNIEQLANDRNLIIGSTPPKQMLKLMEEFGELCAGIAKNKPEMIKDAIGDCVVVLTILNKQYDLENRFAEATERFQMPEEYEPDLVPLDFIVHSGGLAMGIATYEYPESVTIRMLNNIQSDILKCFGSLLALCYDKKLSMQDCVQHAYNQIKDRKGKMIDGVFVKEEDW